MVPVSMFLGTPYKERSRGLPNKPMLNAALAPKTIGNRNLRILTTLLSKLISAPGCVTSALNPPSVARAGEAAAAAWRSSGFSFAGSVLISFCRNEGRPVKVSSSCLELVSRSDVRSLYAVGAPFPMSLRICVNWPRSSLVSAESARARPYCALL